MSDDLERKLADLRAMAEKLKWPAKRLKDQEDVLKKRYQNATGGKPAVAAPTTLKPGGGYGGYGNRSAPAASSSSSLAIDDDYVLAPYRFLDIPASVLAPPHEVAVRLKTTSKQGLLDVPLSDGISGRLTLEWEAETPLLIGANTEEDGKGIDAPLKLGTDYWIPGASIRGMIRAAAEICGFGRLSQINRHHVYPLRDFMHPIYNGSIDGGAPVSKPQDLRTGWLFRREDGSYAIQNSRYAVIPIAELVKSRLISGRYTHETWLRTDLIGKYVAAGMTVKAHPRELQPPPDFRKVFTFSSAGIDAQRRTAMVPATTGEPGCLVFAGPVPKGQEIARPHSKTQPKQSEFVFLTPPDVSKATGISDGAFDRFEVMHTEQARKGREPYGTWKLLKPLLKTGVPIFYVGDPSLSEKPGFAFGLTRAFKIPHLYGVKDKLAKLEKHKLLRDDEAGYAPDMVEALFGYVHEPDEYGVPGLESNPGDALKGRLAFSGARIGGTNAVKTDTIETVMSAPRASFGPFYLKGEIKDWSDAKAELAGRKRYLPRATSADTAAALDAIRKRLKRQIDASNANESLKSRLQFLHGGTADKPAPLRFSSDIDLHNITPEEFGLLLFVLTHGGGEKRWRHMLGRAKPFGAGQLRLVSLDLRRDWVGAEASALFSAGSPERGADGQEGWLPDKADWSMAPFLDAYARHAMSEADHSTTALKTLLAKPAIREWLATCDPANGAQLNGPGGPERITLKTPPPFADNYLRLRYEAPDDKTGAMRRENPYMKLRKATQLQEDKSRPKHHPPRLLPGDKPR